MEKKLDEGEKDSIAKKAEIQKCEQRRAELQQQAKTQQTEFEMRQKSIASLEDKLSLQRDRADFDNSISEELSKSEQRLAELKREVSEHEGELQKLRSEKNDLEKNLQDFEDEQKQLEKQQQRRLEEQQREAQKAAERAAERDGSDDDFTSQYSEPWALPHDCRCAKGPKHNIASGRRGYYKCRRCGGGFMY